MFSISWGGWDVLQSAVVFLSASWGYEGAGGLDWYSSEGRAKADNIAPFGRVRKTINLKRTGKVLKIKLYGILFLVCEGDRQATISPL